MLVRDGMYNNFTRTFDPQATSKTSVDKKRNFPYDKHIQSSLPNNSLKKKNHILELNHGGRGDTKLSSLFI